MSTVKKINPHLKSNGKVNMRKVTTATRNRKNVWNVKNIKNVWSNKIAFNNERDNYSWYNFCDQTSIHGLQYIHRRKQLQVGCRFLWIVIWLTMFSLTVWFCTKSIITYLRYEIKAEMFYQQQDELQFPAVTFCNLNVIKRSISGSSPSVITLTDFYVSYDKEINEIFKQIQQDTDLCRSPYQNKFTFMDPTSMAKYGIVKLLHDVSDGHTDLVKKCWWNNVESKCDKLFIDHLSDYGWCFSFNPNIYLVLQSGTMFGINRDGFYNKVVKVSGPLSGVKILLSTDQKEYCGNMRNYSGAGFKLIIHDQLLLQPSFNLVSDIAPISLSPGTEIKIGLKPIKFYRHTEHLGKCRSPQYYVYNDTKVYYKTICYTLCSTFIFYEKCKCFPNWIEGNEKFFSVNLNVALEAVKVCDDMNGLQCLQKYIKDTFTNLPFLCENCRAEACSEIKYDQTISMSSFPSKSFEDKLAIELGTNITEMKKNYVLVNIFFQDMNLLNVIESQTFTFIDTIIYCGGILGLFLGMSFISAIEPVDEIIRSIERYIEKSKSTTSVRVIHKK